MPRQAANALKWNPQAQAYELHTELPSASLPIVPGSETWAIWLESISSFAFHSRYGHVCTMRKERVQRGDAYWYGYRRQGEKMVKRYVGRGADLTLERLETLAALLNTAEMPDAIDTPSPRGKADIVLPARHPSSRPAAAVSLDRAARSGHPEASATATTASMPDPLLATKLRWPRPRAGLVHRGHLLDQLQQGAQKALTLISAPAGFGKTTLLAQWLATSGMPAAWLSLEPSDNEPGRFLTYMIAALRTLDPQLGANTLPLLEAPQPTPMESILALLANDILARHPHDFLLVLDDYYLITAEPIQRAMTFLIEHLPPQLHVVIATRADPPLPLARLRALGQLSELRAADLQFSSEETSAFLRTMSGLALPPEHLAAIERRTEGWIAGLQLAALSLQGRSDVGAFLASFTGSHRFILDYLSEEVLARQPDAVQAFLLQTSILERLSGPLCEAVTGQRDGQAMLEALDRANLFVISLDDERQWYRYHHLFADVLQRRLQQAQPALMADLHQRASAWYEQHNFAHEAVQHALAARDFEHAARLIERYAMAVFRQGQTALLVEWIKALPDALVRTRPLLMMNYASALQLNDQLEEAEAHLQDVERALDGWTSAEEAGTVLGNTAVLRANSARFRGDLASYVALARTALDLVPEAEVTLRAVATMQVAHAFLVSGDVTASAEQQVYTAITEAASSGYSRVHHRSLVMLARLRALQGRLRDAAGIYEQAGKATPGEQVLQVLNSSVPYFFGLGDLLREWNRLDEAERLLLQGMESISGARSTFADDMLQGYLALARLYQARGEYGQAQAALDTFASLADARHFIPHLSAQAAAALAQLDLMRGYLPAAIHWADESGLSTNENNWSYPHELEYLTLARVRIAEGQADPVGRALQEALRILERLLGEAEAKARLETVLEILALQALALSTRGDQKQALATLERALAQAAPEGYIRLFVDEGPPMLALLRQAQAHGIATDYVARLLAAFGEPVSLAPQRSIAAGAWIEPLTEREREVLHLLATGASNGEIARRLIVSVGTVKKHVSNICAKLGVHSRTQAILRARTLHLL